MVGPQIEHLERQAGDRWSLPSVTLTKEQPDSCLLAPNGSEHPSKPNVCSRPEADITDGKDPELT